MVSYPIDGNRGLYESRAISEEYETWGRSFGLFAPEKVILDRLLRELAGRSLLDMGVGSGRTTPALSAVCGRYTGINYSRAMVERCEKLFSDLAFQRQDARDLSAFAPQSYAAVWFSFNGIDYVPPEDRPCVLRESSRVLRPGGALIFSSHNLLAPPSPPALFPQWRHGGNPLWRQLSNLRRLLRHARHHFNYLVRKAQQRSGDGQALLVDCAHDYQLMTAFVTPEFQQKQLEGPGFGGVEIYASDGTAHPAGVHSSNPWLYYLARKRTLNA